MADLRLERRRHRRVPRRMPLALRATDGDVVTRTVDISLGGAHVELSAETPLDRELVVLLYRMGRSLTLRGEVAWRGRDRGVGIRFVRLSTAARDELSTIIGERETEPFLPPASA
ncbi:MAG: PilZ domain-containing protein [Myxococcota bacterium]